MTPHGSTAEIWEFASCGPWLELGSGNTRMKRMPQSSQSCGKTTTEAKEQGLSLNMNWGCTRKGFLCQVEVPGFLCLHLWSLDFVGCKRWSRGWRKKILNFPYNRDRQSGVSGRGGGGSGSDCLMSTRVPFGGDGSGLEPDRAGGCTTFWIY